MSMVSIIICFVFEEFVGVNDADARMAWQLRNVFNRTVSAVLTMCMAFPPP